MMKTWALLTALAISQLHVVYGTTTKFNATFDTLTTIPDEARLSPVGIYLNISFSSFDVSDDAIAVAGLLAESKPNFAIAVGTAASPSEMTISYTGSKVKSFALSSTYFGCTITSGQGLAAIPTNCTITATGYKAGSSKAVALEVFTYTVPEGALKVPLSFGTFGPAFTGLQTVTYGSSPAGTNLHLDNVVGTKVT